MIIKILDMPDNGRDKKPWLSMDDRDVTNGLVMLKDGYPWCTLKGLTGKDHGHMLCVSSDASVFRCNPGIPCGTGCKVERELIDSSAQNVSKWTIRT